MIGNYISSQFLHKLSQAVVYMIKSNHSMWLMLNVIVFVEMVQLADPGNLNVQFSTVYNRPARNPTVFNYVLQDFLPREDKFFTNFTEHFNPRPVLQRKIKNYHELKHKELCAVSINADSINSQYGISKLEILARDHNADIIMVQESSFNPKVDSIWTIHDYEVVSLENKTWGTGDNPGMNGGVAILVKKQLKHLCKTVNFTHNFKKAQVCAIRLDKLTFINVYRSPNQEPEEAIRFAQFVRDKFPVDNTIIYGDWNLSSTDFQSKTSRRRDHRVFVKAFDDMNLTQHVNTPTHGQNIIDLCLSKDREFIREVFVDYEHDRVKKNGEVVPLFNHFPIITKFATRPNFRAFDEKKDIKKVDVYKFRKKVGERIAAINYEHEIMHFPVVVRGDPNFCFCGEYKCDLEGLCKCGNYCDHEKEIETRNKDLAVIIKECFDECCPTMKIYHYNPSKNRISQKVLDLQRKIKNAKKAKKKEVVDALQIILQEYVDRDLEAEVDSLCTFWAKDPNNVYRTLDRAKKGKPKSNGLYKDIANGDYDITYCHKEQSNILLKHGARVLIDSDPDEFDWIIHVPENDAAPYPAKLYEVEINVDIISFIIDERLNKKYSSSRDGVSVFMIKSLGGVIVPKLVRLYKLCYGFKYLPLDWRTSKQTYIPKKAADLCDPNNLRGLNVCSCLYFPLEYLLCNNAYDQLERRQAISPFQYGFREKRGCEMQLVHFYDEITHILNKKEVMAGVIAFFDFEKAFDRCDMKWTNIEMANHGFSNGLGRFFQSWMRGSKQYVRVGNEDSEDINQSSGIKQGSIFSGKVGFTLLINDLFETMNAKARELGVGDVFVIKSYADDTKYFLPLFSNVSFREQVRIGQELMDTFVGWCKRKNMSLNKKKCKLMFVLGYCAWYQIDIDGEPMSTAEKEVDLGLITVPSLSWKPHLVSKTNDALRVIGTVKDIIPRVSYDRQLMLYNALVRSVLIYASPITYPTNETERKLLRKVFKNYWRKAGQAPPNSKMPITPLMFCLWKDFQLMRRAIFRPYPFCLGPYEDIVPKIHKNIRKTAARVAKLKSCFVKPEGNLRDYSRKIERLSSARRNSFRYRNLELFQRIPVEKVLQPEALFKQYCLEEFIPNSLPEERLLAEQAHNGTLRRQWLKKIHFIKNLQNTTNNETYVSDSEDEL